MKIKKRDGSLVDFNKDKIINAISKAGYVDEDTKSRLHRILKDYVTISMGIAMSVLWV